MIFVIRFRKSTSQVPSAAKKIKFTKDNCVLYLSRHDFSSEESYQKFLDFVDVQRLKLVAARNQNSRKNKKLKLYSGMINDLKNNQETAAVQYLQVTL